MTSRDFCYWLQGYFEITGCQETLEIPVWRLNMIRKHLAMVFIHEIDPSHGSKAHQETLNKIHTGEAKIMDQRPRMNC